MFTAVITITCDSLHPSDFIQRVYLPHSVTSTSSGQVSSFCGTLVWQQVRSLLKIFLWHQLAAVAYPVRIRLKGANEKGSLCCLGHKETQWGSDWAAAFYHSASLSHTDSHKLKEQAPLKLQLCKYNIQTYTKRVSFHCTFTHSGTHSAALGQPSHPLHIRADRSLPS